MAQLIRQRFCAPLLLFISISSLLSPSNAAENCYTLNWKSCTLENFPAVGNLGLPADDISKLGTAPNLDCADLEVPVDWNHPDGEKITLGMTRHRAGSPEKKVGSLVYNPGGPGGAGSVSAIAQALGLAPYSNATAEYYDVIGLDPRGIGMSTPVKCDPELYNKRVTLFPSNEEEFNSMVAANKALGESCRDKTGALFFHLDTTSAAHDLEAVRQALGEDKLNWIGLSYGTMLGAAYAELYPNNVGRMVLDGNVDHSLSETSALHAESSTYEDALNQFFLWCNTIATLEECPLKGRDLPNVFDQLVATANKSPIPALECSGNASSPCRPDVNGEDIRTNIQGNGYLAFVPALTGVPNSGWATLAGALNATLAGDASGLSSSIATSETDPSYPGIAIGCLDWYHNATTFSDVMYRQQMANYIAPHTRGASQTYRYQTACIGWPADVQNPNHALDQNAMSQVPPILMVNAYHDPESSYVWAEGLRTQIPSAVLVSRNGSGHTSYSLEGEATSLIDAYLVYGALPAENTVVNS